METNEAFAPTRRTLIDTQTGRLTEAAGRPPDDATNRAFAEVAAACRPEVVNTLVALLRRLRAVAPERIAACPVVAFTRYGQVDGMLPVRGVAVTADGGRYNVHTVFWDERTARWEGQNGRYGVAWHAARDEMNHRADLEVEP